MEIAGKINRDIHSITTDEHFATMFLACYQPLNRTLSYIRAGHPAPLVIPGDGRKPHELSAPGFLVGIMEDLILTEEKCSLEKGDRVILFTDGITEVEGPGGELFGPERLIEVAAERPESLTKKVYEKIGQWGEKFNDDVTMVDIEVIR
ncbi:MAG: serine/threonine-protein phosphatase [Rhodopseudomonas palustris]|nr:serine/threonine-protein phosphatase [Rhodopseudomonas palustris]